jgi:hypothetical protein
MGGKPSSPDVDDVPGSTGDDVEESDTGSDGTPAADATVTEETPESEQAAAPAKPDEVDAPEEADEAGVTAEPDGSEDAEEVEAPDEPLEPEPAEPASEAAAAKVPKPALLERAWVLLALYAGLAVVLTWPLVAHITDSLTYGTEPVSTVPLFNLWTLEWNQLQVGDLYGSYWDAPLFHPTSGAFALSEPQPVTGLVFTPIAWLSGNTVLGYNLVALLILAVNGYAGSRLARALGASPGPAALAGALACGLSFTTHQMGVLQLTAVFPLLLLLEAVVRWAPGRSSGFWPAARMGIWLAVTFLTCGYYGLFAIVTIGPVALVLVRRDWLTRDRLIDLAVAVGAFVVLALPIVLAQSSITSEYERSTETIRNLSAGGRDFWQLAVETNGAGIMPWLRDAGSGDNGLYPGTGLLVLAAAGLLLGSRDPGAAPSRGSTLLDERRRPLFLFLGVCLAWLLSRGLKLSIFGRHPYEAIRDHVPGFEALRSPFRFAVLAELFLIGLAAYGLDALWHWRWRRLPEGLARRLAGPVLAGALVAFSVVEVSIVPVKLFEVDDRTPGWVSWLEDEPRESWASNEGPADRPVLAFVPFPINGHVASYETTVRNMRHVLEVEATTVNGYSGLFPDEHGQLENALQNDPTGRGVELLREYGVDYLLVSSVWPNHAPDQIEWLSQYPQVFTDTEITVYWFR